MQQKLPKQIMKKFLVLYNTKFGRSQGTDIIQSIPTEQYRFRTIGTDVPMFTFSKSVAGRNMVFEILMLPSRDNYNV